ncbi:MAG: DNA polymerase II, partial [Treponema sp.]|nr:DNA polymerase II [Treponema sp.]
MHITAEAAENFSGFLIHVYPDTRKNRMYLLGRLSDGRSFAAVEDDWRPYFHIPEEVFPAAAHLLKTFDYKEIKALESFSGREKLVCLQFNNYNERYRAAAILEENNIQSPDASIKPAEQFLTEKQLRGYVRITGVPRGGRMVDVIIKKPDFSPPPKSLLIALRIASIDIETDVNTNIIRAIGIAWTDAPGGEIAANVIKEKVSVLLPQNASSDGSAASLNAQHSASITFYNSEKQMLSGFYNDIHEIDPDVLTGWNFLDFDFPHLDKRFAEHGLPFSIGRSLESAKFLPGDDGGGKFYNRRSSAALVPGRQVLDALRVMRAGTQGASSRAQSFTLDDVAQKILGEGKTVSETGDDKIAALDRLYCDDPAAFGLYCMRDADLVLKILSKTGLFRLTLERASLTGVSLDKAWTSVVSFERVYGMELAKRGIAPPCAVSGGVTGAAGGTVLDCDSGIFNNVAVFDFRSLYPTVIQTFNIDPLSRERAPAQEEKCIVAPNGARFSREHGLLPPLIAEYFDTRREAIKNGDKTAAQVYKILMNSFYGVLGTSACRYGKSSLAGAITSFARMWLLFSRDWFNKQGMNVLYGDTDSLFVQTNLNDVPLAEFESYCTALVKEINQLISQTIRSEYDLESFIELRF